MSCGLVCTTDVDGNPVVLAVDSVLGVREIESDSLHDLPPLLLPSSRLVGRDTEVAALQAASDLGVGQSRGAGAGVLVMLLLQRSSLVSQLELAAATDASASSSVLSPGLALPRCWRR